MSKVRNTNQRRYKKRRYKKRSNVAQNLMSVARIAGTALSTAKFVASLVNVEYKYYDRGATGLIIDWNGSIINMVEPTQGTQANQRTGDSIKMKTLTLRYSWRWNNASLNNGEVCRIVVIIDKENDISTGAQYFSVVGTANAPYQVKNADTKFDSRVLYDKVHIVDPVAHPLVFGKAVIKLDTHLRFEAGTITAENNAIKMIIINQNPTNGSKFSFDSRTTYIDN